MKLLYIADGRSPIALGWIGYFIHGGHEVHVVSTFHCPEIPGAASLLVIPVALSGLYSRAGAGRSPRDMLRRVLPVEIRTLLRQMSAPFSLPHVTGTLQGVMAKIQPDLVHAMRIPYEGMIAAEACQGLAQAAVDAKRAPLLISVWGNDFTLHAQSTRPMMGYTRKALQAASALHTDCRRDQRLAAGLGFDPAKPAIVLPGGGGVRLDVFHPPEEATKETGERGPLRIINPRGIRAYVQNDTFFQAIPLVLEKYPQAQFVCPGMQGEGQAEGWLGELGIQEAVQLLPAQSREQMAQLFRGAQVSLSITTHDGTPNTLLEAMACGCFPIAGDLESIREWITPGENGILVDPGDLQALAGAILEAIENRELRLKAKERNLEMVRERAEYGKCMREAEEFYRRLI